MPTSVTSGEINKAFVMDAKSLSNFFEKGKRYITSHAPGGQRSNCLATLRRRRTEDFLTSDTISSITDYSNPKNKCIDSIVIEILSDDKEYEFKLLLCNSSLGAPISLSVGGSSATETSSFYYEIEAELKEHCQWYSFLSNRSWFAWYFKIPPWIFRVLSIMFLCMFIFTSLRYINRVNDAKDKISEAIKQLEETQDDSDKEKTKEVIEYLENARAISPHEQVIKGTFEIIVSSALFIIIIVLINKFLLYLFPRAVFEIGFGIQRHTNLMKVRKWLGYWVMTIITGLLVLYCGKSFL